MARVRATTHCRCARKQAPRMCPPQSQHSLLLQRLSQGDGQLQRPLLGALDVVHLPGEARKTLIFKCLRPRASKRHVLPLEQGTSRIFKSYDFSGVRNSAAVGRRMSFSSYPGYLSSLDDFVNVWDTGLASESNVLF